MKMYLVTSGTYSNYKVEGVFSSEAIALEAKDLFQDTNEITPIELDATPPHPPGMYRWHVVMDEGGDSEARIIEAEFPGEDLLPYGDKTRVSFRVWAKDKIHAVKIANEKRLQLIAADQWHKEATRWL